MCIETTAENEHSVHCAVQLKMSNQSVTNIECVSPIKRFRILFRTFHVAEFAVSHFICVS